MVAARAETADRPGFTLKVPRRYARTIGLAILRACGDLPDSGLSLEALGDLDTLTPVRNPR